MKKVDFNKLQAGDLVEVPRTQFAPMRSGWNGWLFSEAVVIRILGAWEMILVCGNCTIY